MKKPLVIAITGPTASGKSALAVELAKKLHTEIVSADSRQIYKDIPIVTAVPTHEEREDIPHHLLEFLELEAYYSASRFTEDAQTIITELAKEDKPIIVCGGSMLYIDSLLYGIDELPTVSDELRRRLTEDWENNGDEWLKNRLKELDPDYYNKVDLKNLKRVFHAIEVTEMAGKSYSSLLNGPKGERKFDFIKICLTGDRQVLFDRINSRVLSMMEKGLEEEARKVYEKRNLNSLNTVGLKEMFAWFEGAFTKDEAIARIQKNTRVYAKKQMTWHKKDDNCQWMDFTEPKERNTERIMAMTLHHISTK